MKVLVGTTEDGRKIYANPDPEMSQSSDARWCWDETCALPPRFAVLVYSPARKAVYSCGKHLSKAITANTAADKAVIVKRHKKPVGS